jgi:hypothetical protein
LPSVLKDWVQELTLAKQGTLLTAVRGPDNARKDHPTKMFVRALRRAILNGAKPPDATIFMTPQPYLTHGDLLELVGMLGRKEFLPEETLLLRFWESQVDDVPHHWLMHFCHATQIVGMHHPDEEPIRAFWWRVYVAIVGSFHMQPETLAFFEHRLRNRGCF